MVSKERLKRQLKNHKKASKTYKKTGKNKSPTVLLDDADRLSKYVRYDFRGDVPLTDSQLTDYIKSEFENDPGLRFLAREVDDDDYYKKLVQIVRNKPEYVAEIKKQQEEFTINGTKRKGIFLSRKKNYFFNITKAHTRKGKHIKSYVKYYDAKTGKSISRDKVFMIDLAIAKGNKQLKDSDGVSSLRKREKEKSKLTSFKRKKESKKRITRLRGRK